MHDGLRPEAARAPKNRIRTVHFSARGTQDRITTARSSAREQPQRRIKATGVLGFWHSLSFSHRMTVGVIGALEGGKRDVAAEVL